MDDDCVLQGMMLSRRGGVAGRARTVLIEGEIGHTVRTVWCLWSCGVVIYYRNMVIRYTNFQNQENVRVLQVKVPHSSPHATPPPAPLKPRQTTFVNQLPALTISGSPHNQHQHQTSAPHHRQGQVHQYEYTVVPHRRIVSPPHRPSHTRHRTSPPSRTSTPFPPPTGRVTPVNGVRHTRSPLQRGRLSPARLPALHLLGLRHGTLQ